MLELLKGGQSEWLCVLLQLRLAALLQYGDETWVSPGFSFYQADVMR